MRRDARHVSHDLTRQKTTTTRKFGDPSTISSNMTKNDKETNPRYKARELLQEDYDNGHILDDFGPDDVGYW